MIDFAEAMKPFQLDLVTESKHRRLAWGSHGNGIIVQRH